MSSICSIRINEEEKDILQKASKIYGCGISSMIKQIVFEKLEDDYDLKIIEEYEKDKKNKALKYYTADETWNILGV